MAKPPGRCIFCQGFHLSKEHLFADWLRDLFPRSAADTHTMGVAEGGPWTLSRQQGHSGSRKIRTVCIPCNRTWINHIDDDAKYVATPLIQGNATVITPAMQKVLANWFIKMAMVGDSRNRKRSVVIQPHRDWLKDQKEPPSGYEVWVSSYEGTDWGDLGFYQNGGHLDFTPVAGPGKEFSGYAQTSFFGLGKMVALVVATDLANVRFEIGGVEAFLRRIWPVRDPINWPTSPVMQDNQASATAHVLQSMLAKL